MDATNARLRHFPATLAHRTQKALRDGPESFGDFRAAEAVRTPRELVRHMTSVPALDRWRHGSDHDSMAAGIVPILQPHVASRHHLAATRSLGDDRERA